MKKFLVTIALVVFSSVAFANKVEEVRVLQQSTTDAGWPKFQAALSQFLVEQEAGKKVLPTKVLAYIGDQYAAENGYKNLVSEPYRETEAYNKAFLAYNKLGEFIELDEVRRRGQAEGFFLPIEHQWLATQNQIVDTVPERTEAKALIALNNQAGRAEQEIKNLQAELARLKQEAGKNPAVIQKIKDLEKVNQEIIGQLSVLNKDIGNLTKDNLETLEKLGGTLNSVIIRQKEQIAIQNQAVINLRNEFGTKVNEIIVSTNWSQAQIQKLWTAVEGFVSQESFSGLATKVNNDIENLSGKFYIINFVVLGLIVCFLILVGVAWRSDIFMRRQFADVNGRLNEHDRELEQISAEMLNLPQEDVEIISKANIRNMQIGQKVSIMVPVKCRNDTAELPFTVEKIDEKTILINISARHDSKSGYQRVSVNTGLISTLNTAVNDGRFVPPKLKAA